MAVTCVIVSGEFHTVRELAPIIAAQQLRSNGSNIEDGSRQLREKTESELQVVTVVMVRIGPAEAWAAG